MPAGEVVSAIARAAYSYRNDPAIPRFPDDRPIVVFDGYCALCTGFAQFVLRHDPAAKFRLLAAQSILGRALYEHYGLDPQDYETNILIADGIAWFKSEAARARMPSRPSEAGARCCVRSRRTQPASAVREAIELLCAGGLGAGSIPQRRSDVTCVTGRRY